MKAIKDLEEKKTELLQKKERLCKDATSKVICEIEEINEELRKSKIHGSTLHMDEWLKMSSTVGEMFKMAFELYVLKGVDIKLELTNHVQWIEMGDMVQFKYAKYDKGEFDELVPAPEELNEAYEEVRETYLEYFGETEKGI